MINLHRFHPSMCNRNSSKNTYTQTYTHSHGVLKYIWIRTKINVHLIRNASNKCHWTVNWFKRLSPGSASLCITIHAYVTFIHYVISMVHISFLYIITRLLFHPHCKLRSYHTIVNITILTNISVPYTYLTLQKRTIWLLVEAVYFTYIYDILAFAVKAVRLGKPVRLALGYQRGSPEFYSHNIEGLIQEIIDVFKCT